MARAEKRVKTEKGKMAEFLEGGHPGTGWLAEPRNGEMDTKSRGEGSVPCKKKVRREKERGEG